MLILNFGCPARTVNKHKGGAVLLKEPELIHRIVKTIRQQVPESVPVTAKMRLGYDNTEFGPGKCPRHRQRWRLRTGGSCQNQSPGLPSTRPLAVACPYQGKHWYPGDCQW